MLRLNIENVFHLPMNPGYNKQDLFFFFLRRKKKPPRQGRALVVGYETGENLTYLSTSCVHTSIPLVLVIKIYIKR